MDRSNQLEHVRPRYYHGYDHKSYRSEHPCRSEKLSVSLPGDLASRIDELAELDGISRSALIQEAARSTCISELSWREADRRAKIDDSAGGLRRDRGVWGADGAAGNRVSRRLRGESASEPPATEGPSARGNRGQSSSDSSVGVKWIKPRQDTPRPSNCFALIAMARRGS